MRRIRRPSKIIEEKTSLQTSYGEIPFVLKLSNARRTISVSINANVEVIVAAPAYVSQKMIFDFLKEKSQWIYERLKEAQAKKNILDRKKYAHGEEFLFLGKKFPIRVDEISIKRPNIKFDGTQWIVHLPVNLSEKDQASILEQKMVQWYRAEAKEVLGGRIFHYSRIMGMEPLRIEVRTQKRIWGNCDPRSRTIHLNWQVILSPLDVIDYIVVHELCHLKVPNHSQKFWTSVEKILPHYKLQKKWLKNHSLEMLLPGQC